MDRQPAPDLHQLIHLFHADAEEVGRFHEAVSDDLPDDYRRLLAHHAHMTVTVEAFHGDRVNVDVVQRRYAPPRYCREILLRRARDGVVVQYGIVQLDFSYLGDQVRKDILGEGIPLGRTLIEHNVMREVQLAALWRIHVGPALAKLFSVDAGTLTYGRTALIYCNGEPAVELLEIVVPCDTMRT